MVSDKFRASRPCANCGVTRPVIGHGWCRPCYNRWIYAGKPDTGPPDRTKDVAAHVQAMLDYLADYPKASDRLIAKDLGLSTRTIVRYRGLLKSGYRVPDTQPGKYRQPS